MGDFLELARARWSVRSFSSRQVEPDKLDLILKAGQIAPTAVNYQPQKIYVLQSPEALGKILAITRSTYNAPTVLLVCYDTRLSWKSPFVEGYDCGEMDASIVCTHMMLEAWDNLPPYIIPVCLLPIGYPSANARPYAPWHDTFRPLEDTVEFI